MKLILLLTVFAIIIPQAKLFFFDDKGKFVIGQPKGIQGKLSYDVGIGRRNDVKKDGKDEDKDDKDTEIKGNNKKSDNNELRIDDDDSKEYLFGVSGSNDFDSDIFNSGLNGEFGIYSRNQENKRKQDLLSSFIQNTKKNDDSLKSINSRNRISGSGQFDAGFDLGNSGGINAINFLKTLQNAGFNVDDLSRYFGNFYDLLNNLAINGDSSKLDKQKINEIILLLKLIQIFQTGGASSDLKQYFGGNAENFLDFIRSLSDDGHAKLNQVNSQDVSDYLNELQNIGKYDLSNIFSRLGGVSFTDNVDNLKSADKWRNRQDEDYTNRQDDNSVSDFLSNLIRLSESGNFDKLNRKNFGSRGSLGGSWNTKSHFGKFHKALDGSANIGHHVRGGIYD